MTRKEIIESRILEALSPSHLDVVDESHQHSVPAGAESHFNVTVVAEAFAGQMRVKRHRAIHELLAGELESGLHALTLTLMTPAEYEARGGEGIVSPACRGGSKAG